MSSRCYGVLQVPRRNCLRSPRSVTHEAFAHRKAARSRMRGTVIVILVDDGMDHDRLFVYSDGAVRGHCDPVVWHDICQFLQQQKRSPIHWTNVRQAWDFLPLSKVKGSLATSTMSAPLSLLSILYCPGPSPRIQLVPEEKYKDAASSVVLLTYRVHTTL